jgi:DNA-binding transcriptional regulator YhcF (GntR family)
MGDINLNAAQCFDKLKINSNLASASILYSTVLLKKTMSMPPAVNNLSLVDETSTVPKYRQVVDNILIYIEKGLISRGQRLPSITELSRQYDLAKATVSKSYDELKQRGVIVSRHGKGFYITSTQVRNQLNVFILFDTLNAYKEILYRSLQSSLPENSAISIYFHHYDKELFRNLIENNVGNFNQYVIMPHFDEDVSGIISQIPRDKLVIIDKYVEMPGGGYGTVYQDFDKDVYQALRTGSDLLMKYKRLSVVLGKGHFQYIPKGILSGIRRFCREYKLPLQIVDRWSGSEMVRHEAYLLFSDNDLVRFVKKIASHRWEAGVDIGLISYDDTPLKDILLDGVTVISTDFEAMGKTAAKMIMGGVTGDIPNPSKLIIRKTL